MKGCTCNFVKGQAHLFMFNAEGGGTIVCNLPKNRTKFRGLQMRYSGRSRSESEKVEVNGGTFFWLLCDTISKKKRVRP